MATLPLLAAILLLGYFFVNQVAKSTIITREYLLGLNLIRQYFVDNYEHIAPYLILPTAAPSGSKQQNLARARPRSLGEAVVIMNVVNSALLGCIAGIIIWLCTPGLAYSLPIAVTVGIVAAFTALMVFHRRLRYQLSIGL